MLLFIDNFDSFTYNLIQYFQILGVDTRVVRNRNLSLTECLDQNPRYIVIGPGPGSPSDTGIVKSLIQACAGKIPLLGVCLGHQALGEAYGADVVRAKTPMHGKTSLISHKSEGVFAGLPSPFSVTRYHSLIVKRETIPECLNITAATAEGEIMGLQHRTYPNLQGVQFHPESILTEHGFTLLKNFLGGNSPAT